ALEDPEINDVMWRFGQAAAFAKATGFQGVQLHAAYGYLLSSFCSPRANKRSDRWGGSSDNRRRLLLEAVRTVREAVGADFAVSVKINCSDYIPGGLTQREALETILCLHRERLDLIDLSGGSFDKSISFATKYKKPQDERLFIGMARAVKRA